MCTTVTLSQKKTIFCPLFFYCYTQGIFCLDPLLSLQQYNWLTVERKSKFLLGNFNKVVKTEFFLWIKTKCLFVFFARLFFNAWSVYTLYHDISYIDNFDINNLCSEVTALTLSYGTFHQIVSNKCNLFSGSSIKGKYSVLRETNFPVVLLLWFPPNPDVWWIQVCWMDPNDFGGILTTSWISPIVPR